MKNGPVVYIKEDGDLYMISYRTKRNGDLPGCSGLRYHAFMSLVTAFNYVVKVWPDAQVRTRS